MKNQKFKSESSDLLKYRTVCPVSNADYRAALKKEPAAPAKKPTAPQISAPKPEPAYNRAAPKKEPAAPAKKPTAPQISASKPEPAYKTAPVSKPVTTSTTVAAGVSPQTQSAAAQTVKKNKDGKKNGTNGCGLVFIAVFLIGAVLIYAGYIRQNWSPVFDFYISTHQLRYEQCNTNSDNVCGAFHNMAHEYSSGAVVIAKHLNKYHEENDIDSALWLLSTLEWAGSNGYLKFEESFCDWIINYTEENGTFEHKYEFSDNHYEELIYSVGEYSIHIVNRYNYKSELYENENSCFKIDDGKHISELQAEDARYDNYSIVK